MKFLELFLIGIFFLGNCTSPEKTIGEKADALFKKEFNDNEPGAAVLIISGQDTLLKKGYGLADLNTQEKITSQTLFNVGSISKTFVSNTILMLSGEGKINLHDSLYKYFPHFKNLFIAKKVRIHHLLTHTSGLPDIRWNFLDSVALLTAKDEENWAPITKADSLEFEPGSHYHYSNPAFNGLALIIQQLTGTKWQEEVRQKIFIPSGMKKSTITDGAHPEQGVAHGYLKKGRSFIEKDYGEEPTFAAAGNGGVWSSVEELGHYENALQNSQFLKRELIERSRTISTYPNWSDSLPPFIGYSWFISQSQNAVKIISHTGTQGGFYADYVSIPDKKFLYIVLCNRPFPRKIFREQVLGMIGVQEKQVPVPK
ncbi:MAG: beta-lactamase family protein [Bacteroidetes bacterium]|nr:beta-lactamase family protein [Bacteroidota bacterium]